MKGYLTFIVLLLAVHVAPGQVTKLTDIEFDEPPRLDFENQAGILHFIEGDFHIASFDEWNNRKSAVYNRITGEVTYSDYFIRNQFDFGDRVLYFGQRRVGNNNQIHYLRLNLDGTFSTVPALPTFPEVFHDGKGYGKNTSGLYEISVDPVSSRLISSDFGNWNQPNVQLAIHGDSLYIARGGDFLIYSIPHDTIAFAHLDYLAQHDLQIIPFSAMEGRFLYEKISEHGPTEIHELGGHGFARQIPAENELPPTLIWRNNIANAWNISRFGPNSIHSQGNMTRMVTFNQAIPDNKLHFDNGILEINRSLDNPSARMLHRFLRASTQSGDASFVVQGLNEGENFVALGIFGPEGAEPFGMVNDSVQVLTDLLPGALGSVDYFLRQSSVYSDRTQRIIAHDNKLWFTASVPGIGLAPAASDGTPEGTFTVDDLFPGTRGLSSGAYAAHDGKLYLLAQHMDLSTALYRIGDEQEPLPTVEPERVDWENVFGGFPESWHVSNYNVNAVQPKVAAGNDGSVYYLSVRGYLGQVIGDTPGVFSFDGEPHPYGFGNKHIQRLHKINAQTGELEWMNTFSATNLHQMNGQAELAVNDHGEVAIFGIHRNTYQSSDFDTTVTAVNENQLHRLSLKTFDTDGNFIRLVNLNTEDFFRDIHFFSYDSDGTYIAAVSRTSNAQGVVWIRFNASGEILQSSQTGIPLNHRLHIRRSDGKYLVSKTENRNICTDCTAEFWVFDATTLNREHYSTLTYNGRLWHPSLHITANGEWWYTGAINGSFKHAYMDDFFAAPASQNYTSNAFLLRVIPELSRVADVSVLREEIISFYPPEVFEDNIYLSYTAVDLENERSPFLSRPHFLDSGHANDILLETAQIDGVGRLENVHKENVRICDARQRTAYAQLHLPDGRWLRAFAAEEAYCGHVDWHLPLPLYQRRYGNRVQIARMTWPFEPADTPVIDALADENEKYMQVFPNPVSNGYFYILPNDGNKIPYTRFHVHDMKGRLVYESSLPDFFNYRQVFLPGQLNAGVYHVVFTGEGARESHRLMLIK